MRALCICLLCLCLIGCVSVTSYDAQGKMTAKTKVFLPYKYSTQTAEATVDPAALEAMKSIVMECIKVGGAALANTIVNKAAESAQAGDK